MACRENNWSLDSASFYTEVTEYHNPDEIEERPKNGCYACDIFIEGASWAANNCQDEENISVGDPSGGQQRGGCLIQSTLRNSISRLPIIRIIPVEMHTLKLQVSNNFFFYFHCNFFPNLS